MRKFMALPAAALVALTLAGPVMAGPSTSNQSGLGETIAGEWYGEGTYGFVFLGEENNQYGFGDIYVESGEWVLCPAPEGETVAKESVTADDTGPGEEVYGFVGTRTYGYVFDLEITLSRRLETGTASGMVELWTETVDECAGVFDGTHEVAELAVSVTGVGDLGTFRGMGSYQVPSEFNGHYSYRGKERAALGTVVAGSLAAEFDWAYMSQLTWIEHVNG